MPHLLITLAAGIAGFILARSFVRRRLRFVDAVQSPFAPFVAGCLAALVFGIGTGLGTASGARALRDGEGRHRLAP